MDRVEELLWPEQSPYCPRSHDGFIYRSYSQAKTERATKYLFPNVESHSHEIVQYAIKTVEQLEVLFAAYAQKTNPEKHKVKNIEDLLFFFTAKSESDPIDKRRQKVFRYFAGAAIYAQIMMKSFENSKIYLDSLSETIQESLFQKLLRVRRGQSLYPQEQHPNHSILSKGENDEPQDDSVMQQDVHVPNTVNKSDWIVPKQMIIDIFFLDGIAKKIIDELTVCSFVKREMDKQEKSGRSPTLMLQEHLLSRSGRLASNECIGNTPFLIVYRGKRKEVSIRRGFELYRPQHPESKEVEKIDAELSEFPTRFSHNGVFFDNSVNKGETLLSLVGGEVELAEKLFKEKHITEIHIKVTDGLRYSYNIDIIDQKLEGDISAREKEGENLAKLTGRQYGKVYDSCSLQEDLFVTVFAQLLFSRDDPYNQRQLQAFEDWSLETIRSITEKKTLYIGFCFGTLLDVGYTQPVGATGSRNALLLALARGFIKFYGNLTDEELHWDPEAREDFGKLHRINSIEQENVNPDLSDGSESKLKKFLDFLQPPVQVIKNVCVSLKEYGKGILEVEPDKRKLPDVAPKKGILQDVIKNRKIAYAHGLYLGSTAKGIVIKLERSPRRLICVWALIAVGIIGFPYTYWPNKSESKDWWEFFRAVGAILELWGALLAFGFLAVKSMFRQWTLTDMFNQRKGCQSFDELIKVIKYTEKSKWYPHYWKKKDIPKEAALHIEKIGEEPQELFKRFKWNRAYKKLENRRRAIELCATLPNPKQIFSYHNSCAFSVTGEGQFEIDDYIDTWDLHGAKYYFGVNYQGDPIVKDAKGDIRKVYFEICTVSACSKGCTCSAIIIGDYHPLQTNKIFQLPTRKRLVGMLGISGSESHV